MVSVMWCTKVPKHAGVWGLSSPLTKKRFTYDRAETQHMDLLLSPYKHHSPVACTEENNRLPVSTSFTVWFLAGGTRDRSRDESSVEAVLCAERDGSLNSS